MTYEEKSGILWREGYLCKEEDRDNLPLVDLRWTLREKKIQIGAKEAKTRARNSVDREE